MSLRTSIILLSLAFGTLVAIVVVSMVVNSPAGKLQAELERLRATPVQTGPIAPVLALPDLRDAPKTQSCSNQLDQFRARCQQAPLALPVTSTR
jgi:hypothetical protein